MALSSLSAVTNSNRLCGYQRTALTAAGTALTPASPRIEIREQKTQKEETMATVKDPVCGMDIDPDNAAASEKYQEKTYHFC